MELCQNDQIILLKAGESRGPRRPPRIPAVTLASLTPEQQPPCQRQIPSFLLAEKRFPLGSPLPRCSRCPRARHRCSGTGTGLEGVEGQVQGRWCRDAGSGCPGQRLFSVVALNQTSPTNRDGNEHGGFSLLKRGAKPQGEQGGRRRKGCPVRDWEEEDDGSKRPCPPPVRLREPVTPCPGEGDECTEVPKYQKKWKNCLVSKLLGWGAESLTLRRGCVPAAWQGAVPRSQSWPCLARWSLTRSFISSFHFLPILFHPLLSRCSTMTSIDLRVRLQMPG